MFECGRYQPSELFPRLVGQMTGRFERRAVGCGEVAEARLGSCGAPPGLRLPGPCVWWLQPNEPGRQLDAVRKCSPGVSRSFGQLSGVSGAERLLRAALAIPVPRSSAQRPWLRNEVRSEKRGLEKVISTDYVRTLV